MKHGESVTDNTKNVTNCKHNMYAKAAQGQKQHAAAVTSCFWIAPKWGTLRTERTTEQRTRAKPKKRIPLKARFLAAGSAIPVVF